MNILNAQLKPLPPPGELVRAPLEPLSSFRKQARDILTGQNERLLIVAGPCSLHDKESSIAYGKKLKKLSSQVEDRVFLVMRAFIEKPRTGRGWKGLLHDPSLRGDKNLKEGLHTCRAIMEELTALGLPLATEFLQPLAALYLADMVTLGFIGARTSASQTHRELASALHCPVGFKNSLSGDISVAVQGALSARSPHTFLTVTSSGMIAEAHSQGNPDTFIVMRGSEKQPNYHKGHLHEALSLLKREGLPPHLFIDCSHGNSGKDFRRQRTAFDSALTLLPELPIRGLMLESHLLDGNQISLTDSCLGWEETEELIRKAALLPSYASLLS